MIASPSDAVTLGGSAFKLKKLIDDHNQAGTKLYKLTSCLLSDVDDLESIRKGRISNSMPDLDKDIATLQSGLATIVDKCEKALAKHQSRSPIGLMKSYISLSKLEEQIRDLNEEVNHTKQRFMIRTQIQQTTVLAEQTTVLATQFTADLSITDQVQALRQGMDKIIHSASEDVKVGRKVFGMATMTIEERKLSLRKASPDLPAANHDAIKETLALKIEALQGAINDNSEFLNAERSTPSKGYKQSYFQHKAVKETLGRVKEDALIGVVSLLQDVQDPKSTIKPIVWFRKGNDLSASLMDLGFHDEALLLSQVCHVVVKRLHELHGSVYASDLASSFHNLGNRLKAKTRLREAVDCNQAAVSLREDLASENPKEYNPALAHSSYNLAICHYMLGRFEEASEAIHVAVGIRMILAANDPNTFNGVLADSYHIQANYYHLLGKHKEDARSRQLAVDIRFKLAEKYPTVYRLKLAESLDGLRFALGELGKYEDAVLIAQRSVDTWRKIAVDNSPSHVTSLALSLKGLAYHLSNIQHDSEGLEASTECLELYRNTLYARSVHTKGKVPCHYGKALKVYADITEKMGHLTEAFNAVQEGVTILENNSPDDLITFCPGMLKTLHGRVAKLKDAASSQISS